MSRITLYPTFILSNRAFTFKAYTLIKHSVKIFELQSFIVVKKLVVRFWNSQAGPLRGEYTD